MTNHNNNIFIRKSVDTTNVNGILSSKRYKTFVRCDSLLMGWFESSKFILKSIIIFGSRVLCNFGISLSAHYETEKWKRRRAQNQPVCCPRWWYWTKIRLDINYFVPDIFILLLLFFQASIPRSNRQHTNIIGIINKVSGTATTTTTTHK